MYIQSSLDDRKPFWMRRCKFFGAIRTKPILNLEKKERKKHNFTNVYEESKARTQVLLNHIPVQLGLGALQQKNDRFKQCAERSKKQRTLLNHVTYQFSSARVLLSKF